MVRKVFAIRDGLLKIKESIHPRAAGHFPESHKQDKDKDARCKNQVFFFFLPG